MFQFHTVPNNVSALRAVGENVKEFFFRVASLAFETSVLSELEKSGSRQIGDVVREYLSEQSLIKCQTGCTVRHPGYLFFFLQESTAIQTMCTHHRRRNSQTAVSELGRDGVKN